MMKKTIEFDANVLMAINGNWQVNANNHVKDHIHYANGTNNWCTEDQDIFDKELSVNNPDYQGFAQQVKEKGFDRLNNIEIGTLWVIKRGITEEMVNIGPADSFGKTP